MSKKGVLGLVFALIAVPAFASAPAFEKIDTDKDGAISESEATTVGISKKLLAKFDLDKNATLNVDEYNSLMESTAQK